MTYTTEGTYYYVVREKIPVGDKLGIVYDETEYRVKVLVEDHHAGVLETTTTIQMVLKNGTTISTSSIAFNNEYQTTAADAVISGSKVLQGGDLEADAFRFNLYQTDDTYDITGLTPVSFVKNEQDGSFRFTKDNTPALHYEQVGTYYYVLIEDASTPVEGIVYDTTVYQFEVTVTDNGIGALECTIACVNGDANRVIFRNVVEEEVVETPDTPDTPDVPATTPYAHSPQTGDGFHVQLWIALLFVSGGGLVVAAMRGRKREES